jgi:hypothetical protein
MPQSDLERASAHSHTLLLAAVLGGVGVLFFVWAEPYLLSIWRTLARWQALELAWIGDTLPGRAIFSACRLSADHFNRLAEGLRDADPTQLSGQTVWQISDFLGRTARWLWAPVVLVMAYHLATYGGRYRRSFRNGIALFAYARRAYGRYLLRVRNALHADLYRGVDAVGKTAWQWCMEMNCLGENEKLDVNRARIALRSQLGEEFDTWAHLIAGPRGWIAQEILQCLPDQTDRENVIRYATRGHRYQATVLLALLLAVRRFGVLGTMHFQGLRSTDRPLWYALASIGRDGVAFVEAAGIMAQYEYEMALLDYANGELAATLGEVDGVIPGLTEALETEINEQPWLSTEEAVWADYDPTR